MLTLIKDAFLSHCALSPIPPLGAFPSDTGTEFRVWAPNAQSIEVVSHWGAVLMKKNKDDFFEWKGNLKAGDKYKYRIDEKLEVPDPASRFQPEGVHGPSQIIDFTYPWTDSHWRGVKGDPVIYELHVGTFSSEGTFEGVRKKLDYLKTLGVTALEIMPLADFPGKRNWGYDGVSLFAPARCYGTPADLQALVDEAHQKGLAVLLDVVYNHLGPDGNYLNCFSPYFESSTHKNMWGGSLNFDGAKSHVVRDFFIQNALHWLGHYHFDGLRLDATHAIVDESPRHFLAELTDRCRQAFAERRLLFIAEDHRRSKTILLPTSEKGWGMDSVWADDFHHQIRRRLAGDCEGYYHDYTGSIEDIALTLRNGWTIPAHDSNAQKTSPGNFVFCIQNHDQIGNRAMGERLHHQIDKAHYRAATALLLLSPHVPLLFMGQEWAASSPFLFFTDHEPHLGKLVVEGRRKEFAQFSSFADEKTRERIPSPQADDTFLKSRLVWEEIETPLHQQCLSLYTRLLQLRASDPVFSSEAKHAFNVKTRAPATILLSYPKIKDRALNLLVNFNGPVDVFLDVTENRVISPLLSTETSDFDPCPLPIEVERHENQYRFHFSRAGAYIFHFTSSERYSPKPL